MSRRLGGTRAKQATFFSVVTTEVGEEEIEAVSPLHHGQREVSVESGR